MLLECVCEQSAINTGSRMLGTAMKRRGRAVQLAMHCRCGRESVLALGMCSTCYTLRRQDEDTSAVCGKRCWSATAIDVESAMHQEQGSGASSCITAYLGSPNSS